MPVIELNVLLTYPSVEGYPRVFESVLGSIGLPWLDKDSIYAAEEREAERKADNGEEKPMLCHPEDELDIIVVPAVAEMVREEAPWVIVVFIGEENADTVGSLGGWAPAIEMAPDDAEVEGSSRSHDCDIW